MKTEQVAIAASTVVVVVAMLSGHDGVAIAAFFSLLAGLGLGRKLPSEKKTEA